MLGASLLSCHHLKYLELEYSREACRHLSWEEWIALPPSTSLAPLYAALQGPASATLRHLALDHCYLAEPAKTRVTVLAGTDGFITGVVDADAHPHSTHALVLGFLEPGLVPVFESLVCLELQYNGISDSGLVALAAALGSRDLLPVLRQLDLGDNLIGETLCIHISAHKHT